MWALRQPAPYEFERIDVPAPTADALTPGEVLLRYRLGGVCGSDLPPFAGVRNEGHQHTGIVGAPLHELVADVVASTVDRLTVGDRVVGTVLPAGLREYLAVPADQLHALSPTLPDHEAIGVQPLATVLCALSRMGDPAGRRAAVVGLGPIGMLFCVVLKARGAHVTGVDRVDRTAEAAMFGIDEVVTGQSGEWAAGLADADRADLVIDAVGHSQEVLADCVDAARPFGEVYVFGLPEDQYVLPIRRFFRKTLTLRGGVTTDWPVHLAAAERFLVDRRDLARAYVTDTYPLADVEEAFLTAMRPSAGRLKVILIL
ncbi:zinc-dependent alcohol dehydrogenase [Actinophytocola oryzae]|uniref:Threonine dehydrogenase-like Zn-dependent dehydrogenase n=1 Tax=Actinophytocola oryzae TaxID=502181 RepID=A0A4R7VFR7_9PSEU|nr:zinc-binding dehydrogenase [Actinophytocola oryzae]TDV47899.1 threonine dehydrogenase-like Zn-dependent dehydrogenase [Actinophytocola oryzae]